MDLLATDKSRYLAQPRPVIVNYLQSANNKSGKGKGKE